MRIEQALRLLPPLQALAPLRETLLASAAPDARSRWGSVAPYLTVGKWVISLERFRDQIPGLLHRTMAHLDALCHHYADALESLERNDPAAAVTHLLDSARLEEGMGRFGAARWWAEAALRVAEGLNTRRAEVETLNFLGDLCRAEANYAQGARHYQRALVLAEAEFEPAGTVEASMRLGFVALALGDLDGAALWLGRAERLAEEGRMPARRARAQRALAETVRRRGDLPLAEARLHEARDAFEAEGNGLELARTLDAQGLLERDLGRYAPAQLAFREALAWERRDARDPGLECGIQLHLAELLLAMGHETEAEEAMRQAERVAITHHLGRPLVQVYTRLGGLRGTQGAETGFVFFEQALALCHLLEPAPALEAEVCRQYAKFKEDLGRPEEARAWSERARELLEAASRVPSTA